MLDKLIIEFDKGLKTLTASAHSVRPHPDKNIQETELSVEEKRHSLGLMRINHCGEVCAQALYNGQSLTAKNQQIVEALQQASKEEIISSVQRIREEKRQWPRARNQNAKGEPKRRRRRS